MQTGGGSPLQTATAPQALPQGTPENPLNARNDAPNGFAGSIFSQPGGGFFPQTGAPVPGGIIEATGGETPEQQAAADPSVFGQVDPMALGSPNPNDFFAGAGLLAGQAGLAGANTVGGVAGSYADTLGPAAGYRASSPATAGGYNASGPAGVERANASLLSDPRLYDPSLVNAATGQASQVGDLPTFDAAQMTEADIQRFMNPYLDSVVDTTLADFDENAGVVRAQQAANAAGAGAFGGSRFGVREAQTEGELGRGRAATAAGLRAGAFDTALSAAGDDVGRRQQAGLANFQLEGERAFTDAAAENQFNLFNTDSINRARTTNAGLLTDAAAYGANAANEFDRLNQAAETQVGLANADAFNRSSLDYAGRRDAAGAFGADALNRSLLDYAGRTDSAGQFNAGQDNQFSLNQFDANNQANFRNADALNTTSRFNAGQQDNALIRQLQAAGLLGDLGATIGSEDRANIGLLAGLGGQQRSIDSEFRNAEPTLVQLLASLQAQQPYQLFQGQNTTGSGTTTERTRDPMGTIGAGAQAGAILFSDARLKRNIETIGYDAAGRRWTEYEYVWGGPRQTGVIAQEVAITDPHAVTLHGSGYLMVNYGAL
jgi:hypothetical protein